MKLVVVFIFLLSGLSIYSQSILTRGEVYDFEVGDEFQYSYDTAPGITVDRFVVLSKDFSPDLDTVFYTLFKSYYYYGPDANYQNTIESTTESIVHQQYTNLGDPIIDFGGGVYVYDMYLDSTYEYFPDTIIGYDSNLCDLEINGYDSYPPEWHSYQTLYLWGRGVGLVGHYQPQLSGVQPNDIDKNLYYYKKGNFECGTPVTASLNNLSKKISFKLYPNPSSEKLIIELEKNQTLSQFSLYNALGENQAVDFIKNGHLYIIETSNLSNGVYYLKASIDGAIVHRPVVVSH